MPLLLAGPVLRRVTPTTQAAPAAPADPGSVSVWVATRPTVTQVTLVVFDQGSANPNTPVATATAAPTPLGDNLSVCLITASPLTGAAFAPSTYYAYAISVDPGHPITDQLSGVEALQFALSCAGSITKPWFNTAALGFSPLAYAPDTLPSFSVPPQDLSKLQLVHASCRRAGNSNFDALPLLDAVIAGARQKASDAPNYAANRPHQLWLTGDQIYADDLIDSWLAMCIDVGGWLMGSRKEPQPTSLGSTGGPNNGASTWLPIPEPLGTNGQPVSWVGGNPWAPFAAVGNSPQSNFPAIGSRGALAWGAGLTVDPPTTLAITWKKLPKTFKARNHLFALGEFYAAYLLSMAPTLWAWSGSQVVPDVPAWPEGQATPSAEQIALQLFGAGTVAVRRALANVPTYMAIDDHEVSDDFFMNRTWCDRILGIPPPGQEPDKATSDSLGRRIVRNGLIAYAMFQSLGNDPTRFASGSPGGNLLSALASAAEMKVPSDPKNPTDPTPGLVGLPAQSAPAALSGTYTQLDRGSSALRLDFTWSAAGWPFEVIALDCRTARGYAGGIDPPMLLSDQPVTAPPGSANAGQSPMDLQLGTSPAPQGTALSIVIVQTPFLGVRFIENHWQDTKDIKETYDNDAESWGINPYGFQVMLARLAARNQYVVLLSGDVHYSFAAAADYYATQPFTGASSHLVSPDRSARIVQLTSSALKNEDSHTHLIGAVGYSGLVRPVAMDNPVSWGGYAYPTPPNPNWGPIPFGVTQPSSFTNAPVVLPMDDWVKAYGPSAKPDWRYQITFYPGSQTPPVAVTPSPLAAFSSTLGASLVGIAAVGASIAGAAAKAHGSQVVGANNLCQVTFTASTPATASVVQTVFWRAVPQGGVSAVTGASTPASAQGMLSTFSKQTTYTVPFALGADPWPPKGS